MCPRDQGRPYGLHLWCRGQQLCHEQCKNTSVTSGQNSLLALFQLKSAIKPLKFLEMVQLKSVV